MKGLIGFLLLTLMAFVLCSDAAVEEQDLDEYCRDYPKEICTLEFIAHCGSDNVVYGNRCMFCNAYVMSGRTLALKDPSECSTSENP